MRAKKTETAVRREQIARAALGIIGRQGPLALNMAGIARRVGLTTSGLYRHYRGKDQVLEAVLEFVGEQLAANVEKARMEKDAVARLRALFASHIALVRDHVGIPLAVFSEGHPAKAAAIRRILHGYMAGVRGIIQDGQAAGEIRGDVPAERLAVLFLGMVQPAAILYGLSGGAFDLDRHAKESWPCFEEMIRAERRENQEP